MKKKTTKAMNVKSKDSTDGMKAVSANLPLEKPGKLKYLKLKKKVNGSK